MRRVESIGGVMNIGAGRGTANRDTDIGCECAVGDRKLWSPYLVSVLELIDFALKIIRQVELAIVIFAESLNPKMSTKTAGTEQRERLPVCARLFQPPNPAGNEISIKISSIHARLARAAIDVAAGNCGGGI